MVPSEKLKQATNELGEKINVVRSTYIDYNDESSYPRHQMLTQDARKHLNYLRNLIAQTDLTSTKIAPPKESPSSNNAPKMYQIAPKNSGDPPYPS